MVAMVTQLSPQPLFGSPVGNPFLFTGRRYTAEDCIGNPALFMPGDFNGDGRVDQSDLDLVLTNLGRTDVPAGWLAVDQIVGGMIDQTEMDLVLGNWGNMSTTRGHHVYDYRARMYEAELGRFVGRDPIGYEAGDVSLCKRAPEPFLTGRPPPPLQGPNDHRTGGSSVSRCRPR